MAQIYEDIVREWYMSLRGDFITFLMDRYRNTNMRLADAENIYQDVFIAIRKNILEGRVKEDTYWRAYIMKIGLNMAEKFFRKAGLTDSIIEQEEDDEFQKRGRRITDLGKQMQASEEDSIYHSEEALQILGEELEFSPEPCLSIIKMSYFGGLSDSGIAEILHPYRDNGKPAAVNAKAVKASRWLCLQNLGYRVKLALYEAGIIDDKPERRTRDGK